jgi:two-component system, chemotaxis family, chemotaxis protein CheY
MRHCLVVDDSEMMRKVAHGLIEELGLTSTEAETADDALVQCRRALPDAILLDWHLPGLSAHEFMTTLQDLPGHSRPAVIYCTSENDPADIARAIKNGAATVLMRPFDQDSLTRALATVGFSTAMLDFRMGGRADRRLRQRDAEFGGH